MAAVDYEIRVLVRHSGITDSESLAAAFVKHARDPLGIMEVHLAPEGTDEIGFRDENGSVSHL